MSPAGYIALGVFGCLLVEFVLVAALLARLISGPKRRRDLRAAMLARALEKDREARLQ